MKESLCIATITLAKNKEEEETLKKSLQELAKTGLPVFITDGGSDKSFINFMKSFPNFTITYGVKGLIQQVKSSMDAAYDSGAKFIFYTEPDKLTFFSNHLPGVLSKIPVDEQTGIILMSRSAKGFASFPAFQQMTETTINNCCAEVIGEMNDYTYGPFLMTRKLIPYLNLINDDIGWGWRPYIFSIAKRLNLKVNSFAEEFYCPAEQQQPPSSENIYRIKQLQQNLQGLLLSTTVDHNANNQ